MKLKKIASLALAGIMAVSMLAGCKDGGNSNSGSSSENTNTTSNVTESVLAKSSKAVNNVLTVNADDTLDKAVTFAAENATTAGNNSVLKQVASTQSYAVNALKVADDWVYTSTSVETYTFDSTKVEDETYWSLYIVTAPKTNDWIAGEVADMLDQMVAKTGNMSGQNCEYSVRVATAEINAVNSGNTDGYLVGIAVTVDDTSNNH